MNGHHSETCNKCITRIRNGNKWLISVTYQLLVQFMQCYTFCDGVRPKTNFTTRIEFSLTLIISFQGSTPRIHSNTPLHDSNQRLRSMTPLHKINIANTFAAFQGSTPRIHSYTPLYKIHSANTFAALLQRC